MRGFDIIPVELGSGAAVTADVHDELAAQLARLTSLVDDVLDDSWRGSAAVGFGSAWAQWSEAASTMLHALAAMGTLLRATGATYAAAEADSTLRP